MNRNTRWFALAALGTVVVLLTGSGLVSLLSDSVTVTGNQAESGSLPSHDVQAAIVATTADCASAGYTDGPVAAAIDADVDLASGANLPRSVMCIKNNGTANGRLVMSFENVVEVEVGACTASEAAVDTSCADADPGELSQVLQLHQTVADVNSCPPVVTSMPFPFGHYLTPSVISSVLPPGGICAVILTPSANLGGPLVAAQTDRLTWDIMFTLEDFVGP